MPEGYSIFKPNPVATGLQTMANIFGAYQQGQEDRKQKVFQEQQRQFALWQMQREKALAITQDRIDALNEKILQGDVKAQEEEAKLFRFKTVYELDPIAGGKILASDPELQWIADALEVKPQTVTSVVGEQKPQVPTGKAKPNYLDPNSPEYSPASAMHAQSEAPVVVDTTGNVIPQEPVFAPASAAIRGKTTTSQVFPEAKPGYQRGMIDGKLYEVNNTQGVLNQQQIESNAMAIATNRLSYNLTVAGLPDEVATTIADRALTMVAAGKTKEQVMPIIKGALERYEGLGVRLYSPETIYNDALDQYTVAVNQAQAAWERMMMQYRIPTANALLSANTSYDIHRTPSGNTIYETEHRPPPETETKEPMSASARESLQSKLTTYKLKLNELREILKALPDDPTTLADIATIEDEVTRIEATLEADGALQSGGGVGDAEASIDSFWSEGG